MSQEGEHTPQQKTRPVVHVVQVVSSIGGSGTSPSLVLLDTTSGGRNHACFVPATEEFVSIFTSAWVCRQLAGCGCRTPTGRPRGHGSSDTPTFHHHGSGSRKRNRVMNNNGDTVCNYKSRSSVTIDSPPKLSCGAFHENGIIPSFTRY